PALPGGDQDPAALGMPEQRLDGARDLRLRGLHAVLAELSDQERRHRFELGLGGKTNVYGDPRHRTSVFDAGRRRLVSTLRAHTFAARGRRSTPHSTSSTGPRTVA